MAQLCCFFIRIGFFKQLDQTAQNGQLSVVLQDEIVMQAFYSYSAWKVWATYMLSNFFQLNTSFCFCLSIQGPEEFYMRKNINSPVLPTNGAVTNGLLKSLFKNWRIKKNNAQK